MEENKAGKRNIFCGRMGDIEVVISKNTPQYINILFNNRRSGGILFLGPAESMIAYICRNGNYTRVSSDEWISLYAHVIQGTASKKDIPLPISQRLAELRGENNAPATTLEGMLPSSGYLLH